MGDTFRFFGGRCQCRGRNALDGRTSPFRRPAPGWRVDDRCVPGVRDLPEDRLQAAGALPGGGTGGAGRPLAAAGALCQPAPGPGGEPDRRLQAREAALGRAQDPRAAGPTAGRRHPHPGHQHHPRRARPLRPGAAHGQDAPQGHRHAALHWRGAERSLVHGLQGRVQARQRPLLLSAHRHRQRLALPPPVRGPESTREDPVVTAFERLFLERGLPDAIRTDNGLPFASPNGLFNLSKLSVWWLRLGIENASAPAIPNRTAVTSACT